MKKKLCIICFSDLKNDPRVYRQISSLRDCFDIDAAGIRDCEIEGVTFYPIASRAKTFFQKIYFAILSLLGLFERVENMAKHMYFGKIQDLMKNKYDLVIANDIDSLPLVTELHNYSKILFDAHEYAPRQFEDDLKWHLFFQGYCKYLCAKYLKQVDAMMTVNDSIAAEYYRQFNVKPYVITNATNFYDLAPYPVDPAVIRIIHHGGAIRSRRIESMITMMEYLDDRFVLDLMLVPTDIKYFNYLSELCLTRKNIQMKQPVAMTDIVSTINSYDIGLFYLEPVNYNYLHALPNKLFEYIQARLAIAIGPSPDMKTVVEKYDCGIISNKFDVKELASKLNGLTKEKIDYYKLQSDKAASDLSQESNDIKLRAIVNGLINEGSINCVE